MSTKMSPLSYNGSSSFYKELTELPVPKSAVYTHTRSNSDFAVWRVSYSIRDHERNVKRSITKTFTLKDPDSDVAPIDGLVIPPAINYDSSEILALIPAPSGRQHVLFREALDASGSKKRYVEVWSTAQREVAAVEVSKLHGQVCTDDYFKSFSFSPSETALVYTAEANPSDDQDDDPFSKFRFAPHFGEQLHSRKRPTLFIFRWCQPTPDEMLHGVAAGIPITPSVTALSLEQPSDIPVVFGQATFFGETRLFVTGYEQTLDGRLLGIQYCLNRPSSIWELILPEVSSENPASVTACQSVKIEAPGRSCRSPRVLFDGDNHVPITLFWLSNPVGGAHASTVSLHARDLKGNTGDRILVDSVWDPLPHEFPGLYADNFANNPFIRPGDENTYILVQSLWRSRQTLLSINVETGSVVDLTPGGSQCDEKLYSWNLLATNGMRSAICSRSALTSTPETVHLSWAKGASSPRVVVLDRSFVSAKLQHAMSRLDTCVIPIPNRHPVETIVIRSKEESALGQRKAICMTIPHGGPHSSTVMSFMPNVLTYALEGYTISMPNYTGSIGFGEKYVQALIGKCGTLDVADCIATVEELIRLGLSERGRQLIQGGSHGGFLTAHLIGQYPDVFTAAVMFNPVISVGEFFCTSDIPDWALYDFGFKWGPGTHIDPERFAALYAASPIAHVDRLSTKDGKNNLKMPPVLLLLGEDDLRVPPTQGKGYYHVLKGRGAVVDMLVFPKETHPINGVEAGRVAFEAGRNWFLTFVPREE